MFRDALAIMTKPIRHRLIKLIAPTFYKKALLRMRPMIFFLSCLKKDNMIGAEIGVLEGLNAYVMFNLLPIKQLFLIDPYQPYISNNNVIDPFPAYSIAKRRLRKYESKIEWILKPSSEATKDIKEKLDFVYIDGNHDYPHVIKDIRLYYQIIKKGGILGGHDYSLNFKGVIKAVNEFVEESNLELYEAETDWWIIK